MTRRRVKTLDFGLWSGIIPEHVPTRKALGQTPRLGDRDVRLVHVCVDEDTEQSREAHN